ncbi:TadE/TadG family type IV pilus assembly protein [Streptomyces acidiscabies]|uniref:TadE/TadG family type IV pilus assembly protein n=1 Tax=Streptomyces acidiscabies TaxID=42234 RepID=UPI00073E22CF|nr:TadE family protein [Streptomyces acidiscabies]GAQ54684.1 TadE-like protein [Streptomyces acidiscabies]
MGHRLTGATRCRPAVAAPRRLTGDRGQVAVEFIGMLPVILVTLIAIWQCVLVGYTYTLAGNAADAAVRAGTVADPGARVGACQQAGTEDLPSAWQGDAEVDCGGSGFVTATVTLHVPVLFPGVLSLPFEVIGRAGAVEEWHGP